MENNEQAGALGIRMIDGSGRFLPESKRSFPAPLTSFYKLTGLSKLFPSSKTFSRYSLAYLNQYENHEVDVLAGAFLMARRDLLNQLNGFDEAFFMYGEDIDLSYRIQKLGYKNFYFSESSIIHFKGESTLKGSLNYVKMFYNAMSIFVKKHYSGTAASLFVVFIQTAIFLRASLSFAARLLFKREKPGHEKLNSRNQKQQKIVIAGTQEEFSEVEELLVKANLKEQIAGRLAVNGQNDNALGSIEDVKVLAAAKCFNEVIFCQGTLTYKSIIELVQQLPPNILVRFHSKGTGSIVGSDSKDTAGQFVAA